MSSIIEESKQSRKVFKFKPSKKIIIISVTILSLVAVAYFYFNKDDNKEINKIQKTWMVKQSDLSIAIEADGKVVAKDGVELSFSVSGDNLEIKEVFVQEGDTIKKGDKIATVKTESLELNVNSAYASYLAALADYNKTTEGASDKEKADAQNKISSAEIVIAQSKISLANIEQSAADSIRTAKNNLDDNRDELTSDDVRDAYDSLVDIIKATSISLDNILKDSDEILGIDDKSINDIYEFLIGAANPSDLNTAKYTYLQSRDRLESLDSLVVDLNIYSDYLDIDKVAKQTEDTLAIFENHLYYTIRTLGASITSSDFTQSELDSFVSNVNTNRATVNTKITTLNTRVNAVSESKDALENYIIEYNNAVAEAARDIENAAANLRIKELVLEQVKRDYQDLLAPLSDAEKNTANSRLTSASVALGKAQLDLEEATIVSPIDGEIAALNYKTGDIIVDSSSVDPVAVIINNDTLFIEVNIEEADINKIKTNQVVYATLDSLDELRLEGEVNFISLTSKTDNTGIVTYLVRIIINDKGDAQVREGMTAFVDFITAEAKDVLIIPVDAVSNVNDTASVLSDKGEWIPVITGFTDGEDVEVISGLKVGDKILY